MKATAFAIVLGLSAAGSALANQFHEPPSARDSQSQQATVGTPADTPRIVSINADTRWVNVRRMEAVRFVIGQGSSETSFVRRIDGSSHSFPLKEIAPSDVSGVDQVRVYVQPDRVTRR